MLASTLVRSTGCASDLHRPVSSAGAVTNREGVQRIDVGLHGFRLRPNRIMVHTDRPVELVLRNRALLVPTTSPCVIRCSRRTPAGRRRALHRRSRSPIRAQKVRERQLRFRGPHPKLRDLPLPDTT
jgi:hypothetical protein